MASHSPQHALTAREAGLVGCRRCAQAWPKGTQACGRCGSHLQSRDVTSLQRVWAWWTVGLICYIPANIYPMLNTRMLFDESQSTIVGGAVELMHHGSYFIPLVILFASVVIPLGKFAAIAYLALTMGRAPHASAHPRQGMYELVEYIGRWSMIDVFVVAILSSLVHLGSVVSITPGPASLTFALSVIFTMLSALSFDSRMIWDQVPDEEPT